VCALLAVVLAAPALAARVIDVRVGRHPEFTRVVFELDDRAGYRVVRKASESGGEDLLVYLDAASSGEKTLGGDRAVLERLEVKPREAGTAARIRLNREGLLVKEMILARPPRIVLDVVHPAAMIEAARAKAAPAPKPAPAAAREPKPEPVKTAAAPTPAAKPTPEPAAKPTPKPVAKPTPKPVAPAAEPPKPQAAPVPAPKQEPTPALAPPSAAPVPTAKAPAPPAPEPEVEPPQPKPQARTEPAPPPSRAEPGAPPAPPEETLEPELAPETTGVAQVPSAKEPAAAPAAQPTPPPRERPPVPPARVPEPAAEPAAPGLGLVSKLGIAGAVAGVALLVVFVLLRRRGAARVEEEVAESFEAGAADREDPFAGLRSARSDTTEIIDPTAAGAAASLFDEDSTPAAAPEQEEQKELDMDLHTTSSEAPTRANLTAQRTGSGGAAEGDLMQVVRELERRMAHLETRLDEEVDARERLERQVAAQTEELRVQRAAIARTQRALRNMTRPEDEAATEPAPREQ
jgi:hypothetical protein